MTKSPLTLQIFAIVSIIGILILALVFSLKALRDQSLARSADPAIVQPRQGLPSNIKIYETDEFTIIHLDAGYGSDIEVFKKEN